MVTLLSRRWERPYPRVTTLVSRFRPISPLLHWLSTTGLKGLLLFPLPENTGTCDTDLTLLVMIMLQRFVTMSVVVKRSVRREDLYRWLTAALGIRLGNFVVSVVPWLTPKFRLFIREI